MSIGLNLLEINMNLQIFVDRCLFVGYDSRMSKKLPLIRCRCCNSVGWVELPSTYRVVYEYIKKHPGSTMAKIHEKAPVKVEKNNITNQLIYLLKVGVVRRERGDMKVYEYTVTTNEN